MFSKRTLIAAATVAAFWDVPRARAVIVTGPQGRNTSAPTGTLAGSGWDLEGAYGAYLGTPISADYFITAAHFGNADSKLSVGGIDHPVVGDPVYIAGTDLVLRQVSVPFTTFAPILNSSTDAPLTGTDNLVDFGRGTQRGDAIGNNGWAWGPTDTVKSWGSNAFGGFAAITAADVAAGANFAVGTRFVTADFDNAGDPNEGTLSDGDSGGGVFVKRGGQWKLVGINYGVELFRSAADGPDLRAAVYDARGLYQDNGLAYAYVDPAGANAVPQTWFASYVPDALGRIVTHTPEPAVFGLFGTAVVALGRRRR